MNSVLFVINDYGCLQHCFCYLLSSSYVCNFDPDAYMIHCSIYYFKIGCDRCLLLCHWCDLVICNDCNVLCGDCHNDFDLVIISISVESYILGIFSLLSLISVNY
jgi:hypothetical protein